MSRTHWLASALIGGALLASAPAAALADPPAHGDQCFLSSNVEGFRAHDDKTLYIRVGVSEIYRLDLMSNCFDLSYREALGFEHTPGNPWICSPLDATVVYRTNGIPNRCPVSAIHKLTPAEITALPKKDKP
jgi:hypothetical protein